MRINRFFVKQRKRFSARFLTTVAFLFWTVAAYTAVALSAIILTPVTTFIATSFGAGIGSIISEYAFSGTFIFAFLFGPVFQTIELADDLHQAEVRDSQNTINVYEADLAELCNNAAQPVDTWQQRVQNIKSLLNLLYHGAITLKSHAAGVSGDPREDHRTYGYIKDQGWVPCNNRTFYETWMHIYRPEIDFENDTSKQSNYLLKRMLDLNSSQVSTIKRNYPEFTCAITGNIMLEPISLEDANGRRIYCDRANLKQYLETTGLNFASLSTADFNIITTQEQEDFALKGRITAAIDAALTQQNSFAYTPYRIIHNAYRTIFGDTTDPELPIPRNRTSALRPQG